MRYPDFIEQDYKFPGFYHITHRFPRPQINSIPKRIKEIMAEQIADARIKSGEKMGVGVGSRDIRNIAEITRLVCQEIKAVGAKPFLIPVMGSHGAATRSGQEKVLASLGITPDSCGCSMLSGMDATRIGMVFGEVPVYYAKDALSMDHCICINRIKPHTKFKGTIESGITKMLCIGMGKHLGALAYHNYALRHGFFNLLKKLAEKVMETSNFRFGIGIVENAYDETAQIEGLPRDSLFDKEERLLAVAKSNMPKLPLSSADVLVLKQIGKDISGAGMDPNITGRASDLTEDDFSENFYAKRLAVLNLSEKSNGNGLGIGNADFITEKVFREFNYEATLINALTSSSIKKASVPIRMPDDRKAIQACFTTIGPIPANQVEAIVIKDTLNISQCLISEALVDKVKEQKGIEIRDYLELEFDTAGNLVSL